jgi:tRNA G18 (ribose-2'-O)-methylase SpoU
MAEAAAMRLIPLDDPADPRLAPYRVVRERDLAGRTGAIMLEGEVVVRLAIARGLYPIESVLAADNRVAKLADAFAALPRDTPVYVAPRTVVDTVAGFPLHRGLLAVARRPPAPPLEALLASLPAQALVLGLCGLANHDNVGGAFRNAAAFGCAAVALDQACADPLYRKAIRVSVGAALTLPHARARSAEAMVAALEAAGFEVCLLSPRGALAITALAPVARRAILIGTEGDGLPDALLARGRAVSIPMPGAIDSLNAATAAGIALFHASLAQG